MLSPYLQKPLRSYDQALSDCQALHDITRLPDFPGGAEGGHDTPPRPRTDASRTGWSAVSR